MKFSISDLSDDSIHQLLLFANDQAHRLYDTRNVRKDTRTLDEILDNCIVGSIPEFYLLQEGFRRNPGVYQDLYDKTSNKVEIKSCLGNENSLIKAHQKTIDILIMESELKSRGKINKTDKLFDFLFLFSNEVGTFTLKHILDRSRKEVDINEYFKRQA